MTRHQVKYILVNPVLGFDRLDRELRELPVGALIEMPLKRNEIGLVWALHEGRSIAVFPDDVERNGEPTDAKLGEIGI